MGSTSTPALRFVDSAANEIGHGVALAVGGLQPIDVIRGEGDADTNAGSSELVTGHTQVLHVYR